MCIKICQQFYIGQPDFLYISYIYAYTYITPTDTYIYASVYINRLTRGRGEVGKYTMTGGNKGLMEYFTLRPSLWFTYIQFSFTSKYL